MRKAPRRKARSPRKKCRAGQDAAAQAALGHKMRLKTTQKSSFTLGVPLGVTFEARPEVLEPYLSTFAGLIFPEIRCTLVSRACYVAYNVRAVPPFGAPTRGTSS